MQFIPSRQTTTPPLASPRRRVTVMSDGSGDNDVDGVQLPHAVHAQAVRTRIVRRAMRALFALTSLLMSVNLLSLLLLGQDWRTLIVPLLAWHISAGAGAWVLQRRLPGGDRLLYGIAMLLTGWGLVAITRLLPDFGVRQSVWLVVATAGFAAIIALPNILQGLRSFRYLLLLVSLALLALTIVIGTNPEGGEFAPRLWIGFGGIFFQPSELLKITMVAFLASYLAEQAPFLRTALGSKSRSVRRAIASLSPRIVGPVALMWLVSVIFLILQRDLGAAMLFFIVFLILIYTASGSALLLLVGGLLVLIAGTAAYFAFDVVQLRVDIWLNPWPEASGRAYQIVQSLMAVANGGIFGQGVAQGYPDFIPVVHSDFIFAALAEEWGFIGVTVLIAACAAFLFRGFTIALRQEGKPFYSLLAVGLTSLVGIQSLLILGGVLKLIPLTGVTLPFLSYGGSSLVVNFAIVGLLIRLSSADGSPADATATDTFSRVRKSYGSSDAPP